VHDVNRIATRMETRYAGNRVGLVLDGRTAGGRTGVRTIELGETRESRTTGIVRMSVSPDVPRHVGYGVAATGSGRVARVSASMVGGGDDASAADWRSIAGGRQRAHRIARRASLRFVSRNTIFDMSCTILFLRFF